MSWRPLVVILGPCSYKNQNSQSCTQTLDVCCSLQAAALVQATGPNEGPANNDVLVMSELPDN